ncbi:MAG: undecaprenyldiphospho-muramoylpentapeptide beta-N-acetylglucosaminyltransferase [Myxococcota bacterium]
MTKKIIVAGGGTGGHLFPGIAVVEEMRRRLDVDVLFVGTERGIEARVLPGRGERVEFLEVTPLKGRSAGQLMQSLGRLPRAAIQAGGVVRAHQADLVLGVGGYASGPVLAAAAAMGTPTAVLEQNAHLGLTNRMLAPVVGRGYVTFESTLGRFGKRGRLVGNPVRREFAEAARRAAIDPVGFEARANTILVMGGSQGAKALNETVPTALAAAHRRGLHVVHQTGAAMRDEVEARYEELGVSATVVSFIDDMAQAYAAASLVIARAGASTLAELCAVGRPSILVPYPFAADDHQRKNAEALEAKGAAICIPQDELRVHDLASTLDTLLGDPNRRRSLADAARREGRPDAAAAIVDDLCSWLDWSERTPTASAPPSKGGSDEEPEEPVQRSRLRGERHYTPQLSSSVAAARPRRPLVFDGSFVWE